ncbi:hypothetical protein M758_UG200200 [Ceratodon purpureus]|nr:hypothetical protein M758_UG200200 [Ceratodon purpureus]
MISFICFSVPDPLSSEGVFFGYQVSLVSLLRNSLLAFLVLRAFSGCLDFESRFHFQSSPLLGFACQVTPPLLGDGAARPSGLELFFSLVT